MKILDNNLTGYLQGKKLDQRYRAVIKTDRPEPVIQVEQEIDGDWHGTGGSWYVSTILESVAFDRIAIDFGQGWEVAGVYHTAVDYVDSQS